MLNVMLVSSIHHFEFELGPNIKWYPIYKRDFRAATENPRVGAL